MMVRDTHQPIPNPQVTRYLRAAAAGDAQATVGLFEAVYQTLRTLAAQYLDQERADHTLQPTALVHEAFIKLVGGQQPAWNDRAHFFAVAARAMRRILINHALAKKAAKRGGMRERSPLSVVTDTAAQLDVDLLDLDAALSRLANLDARQAEIVELRFFGGLTNREVADVMGVSLRTVEGDWAMARAWLLRHLSESGAHVR